MDTIFEMYLVILSHRQEGKWLPNSFKKKKKKVLQEGYFMEAQSTKSLWDESCSNVIEPETDSKQNTLVGLKTTQQQLPPL